jgi:hypothetical protein
MTLRQDEFPRPEGLRTGALLDSRWPVSYEQSVPQAVDLVTRYFSAWSRRDLDGVASVLHFPFAIFEQTDPIVFETAEQLLANPPLTLAPEGREVDHPGHFTGRIAPGSYNLLHTIEVPLFSPIGAAATLAFSRHTESGQKLLEADVLFAVTNNDGRWGIHLASSILKPVDHLGVPATDAEMAALRALQDGYLEYTNRHLPAGEADPDGRFFGRSASVSIGNSGRDAVIDARNDQPMVGWTTAGVQSRLNVSELTPDSPFESRTGYVDPDPQNPRFTREYDFAQFADIAGGNVGQYGNSFATTQQPLVLGNGRHANMHKAHTWGAYMRHTPDLTLISDSRRIYIRVYREGRWGNAGSIGTVMVHDRSNSYEP